MINTIGSSFLPFWHCSRKQVQEFLLHHSNRLTPAISLKCSLFLQGSFCYHKWTDALIPYPYVEQVAKTLITVCRPFVLKWSRTMGVWGIVYSVSASILIAPSLLSEPGLVSVPRDARGSFSDSYLYNIRQAWLWRLHLSKLSGLLIQQSRYRW